MSPISSHVATGELWWAQPSQTKLQHTKLKYETLYISGVVSKFLMSSPFAQTQSSPTKDFLAMVLPVS